MQRAVLLPDTPDLAAALARAVAAGCTHVEIEALPDRPADHLDALADSGLFVACVRIGRGLGRESADERRLALDRQKRQITDGARLGATLALLTPSDDAINFVEGCILLAAFATARGVQLVVLPEPGTTVPDCQTALALLPDAVSIALSEGDDAGAAGGRLAYLRQRLPVE
jgi:sugar phosphate isomerase/epimerase